MRVRKAQLNSNTTDKVVRVHFLTTIADFYSGVSRHLPTLTPCNLSQKNTYHPLDLSQFLTSFQLLTFLIFWKVDSLSAPVGLFLSSFLMLTWPSNIYFNYIASVYVAQHVAAFPFSHFEYFIKLIQNS